MPTWLQAARHPGVGLSHPARGPCPLPLAPLHCAAPWLTCPCCTPCPSPLCARSALDPQKRRKLLSSGSYNQAQTHLAAAAAAAVGQAQPLLVKAEGMATDDLPPEPSLAAALAERVSCSTDNNKAL